MAATRSTSSSLREPSLKRFFFGVYVLLVVYASLYPLTGWHDPGGPAFAFLVAPWPRYVTAFDLAVNFLGYVPYGLLCVLVVNPRLKGTAAVLLALVSGAALSLSLEATQGFLPARISSTPTASFPRATWSIPAPECFRCTTSRV